MPLWRGLIEEYRAFLPVSDATPVVSREFSRTERLLIRVAAYAPVGGPMAVSARLLSRGGQAMRDLEILDGPTLPAVKQIDLPLAGLAAGDYLIEFAVKSPAGEVKDLLSFRVTN